MDILRVRNVYKSYGDISVLSNISFDVKQGEMIAIIGESGKGKSTLLNIIGLIDKKDSGDIVIFDSEAPSIKSKEAMLLRREKIGYLFQNFGLIDEESVVWNLNLALEYKNLNKKERLSKIDDLLKEFELEHLKNKKIYQLSGGEQQRIAIIRLILQDSQLILADEPTASVDVDNESVIMNYLKKLNSEGKTIIVVTHNKEILSYFTNVIDLDKLLSNQ